MIKILFLCSGSKMSTFVKQDFEILQSQFDVRVVHVKSVHRWLLLAWWSDLVYVWFADLGGFLAVVLAKLFRKKSIVVAGGFDVEFMPEIGYGLGLESLFDKLVTTKLRVLTLRYADLVLCVSRYVENKVILFGSKRAKILYNGVNTEFFSIESKHPLLQPHDVITVCFLNEQNLLKKGIFTFIEVAGIVQKELPRTTFTIMGRASEEIINKLGVYANSKNATIGFLGELLRIEYRQELRNTKIYCQLSATETFGVALAEAMSCGCYPIITLRGALPEVVGKKHKYVTYNNPERVAAILISILRQKCYPFDYDRENIRKYIVDNFDIKIRRKKLCEMVKEVVKNERK